MTFTEEYTLLRKLGEGGFATVFKAQHNALGYVRAIRMLNAIVPNEEDEVYQKFLKECKVLLRLGNGNHPNIVHIYQPRLVDCHALVEMDYVDGLDLIHYIQSEHGFVPLNEVLRMAEEMSSALAYCHHDIYRYCMNRKNDDLKTDPNDGSKVLMDAATERRLVAKYKIIHNDIHSGNIMRKIDGHYMLLDFGLAIEGGDVVHSSRRKNGAPEYKAPEKWDNAGILTEQSDIYSFGIVMYEFLAGRVPFMYDKNNSNQEMAGYEVMNAHLKQAPPPIRPFREEAFRRNNPGKQYDEDYPQWLEDIIMRCLAKDPSKRFANGKELHEAIKRATPRMSQNDETEISSLKADLQHYKDVERQQAEALARSQRQVEEMQRVIEQNKNVSNGVQQSLEESGDRIVKLEKRDDDLQQKNRKTKNATPQTMTSEINDETIPFNNTTDSLPPPPKVRKAWKWIVVLLLGAIAIAIFWPTEEKAWRGALKDNTFESFVSFVDRYGNSESDLTKEHLKDARGIMLRMAGNDISKLRVVMHKSEGTRIDTIAFVKMVNLLMDSTSRSIESFGNEFNEYGLYVSSFNRDISTFRRMCEDGKASDEIRERARKLVDDIHGAIVLKYHQDYEGVNCDDGNIINDALNNLRSIRQFKGLTPDEEAELQKMVESAETKLKSL